MAKTPAIQSDPALINLNIAIADALKPYLPDDVAIRFTLPNTGENPDVPTVSVFLYDIHEDLQLRTAQGRPYNVGAGQLQPGLVHVQCCYLITYWEPPHSLSSDAPDAGPASHAMVMINHVLNGLLNNRSLSMLPNAYARVLPPSEGLNSLGNFWQAMGNKPRLCLIYAVTVPIHLTDPQAKIAPVRSVSHQVNLTPGIDWNRQAAPLLKAALSTALRQADPSAARAADRAPLDKVELSCQPVEGPDKDVSTTDQHLRVTLSGVVTADDNICIREILQRWTSSATPVATLAGYALIVDEADRQLHLVTTPDH